MTLRINWAALEAQLQRHEGVRLKPYTDTVGKLTIGVGRNLSDTGITMTEALFMLRNDIATAAAELEARLPWVVDLSPARQQVLVNMVFNLGWFTFSKFKKMLAALQNKDFEMAAKQMLSSLWARQVGNRAVELAEQMRRG
jgi:lysozyme